jgi:UDP-2,4-diacetamido-2,4,6-trideoxy-beta-L-altropyranose hydrolase
MRDLVLAKEYAEANIYFATMDLCGNINHKIDEASYKRVHLDTNDLDELDKIIKELKIEMIVIDHYGIDYDYEKQLKIQNPKLKILSLDDTYEKHHCDILLNHNICADEKRYKELVPHHCELRCGAKYTLLRDEFKKEKEIQREKIYDIFLAMGGADTAELNIPILKTLSHDLKIAVLTTNANKALQELKEFAQNRPNITLHINSNEVAKLLNESRFAIITPSVTVNEVLFMKVPFLAIKTASNQDDMYEYLKKKKFLVLGEFNSNKFLLYLSKLYLGLLK